MAPRIMRESAPALALMRKVLSPFHATVSWRRVAWQRTAARSMLDCGKVTAPCARRPQKSARAKAVATAGGGCSRKGAAKQNFGIIRRR